VPRGYVDNARTAEQPFDLFVDHLVLRDVMAHLLGSLANDSFGLLTGELCTCSSSEMPYVRIRSAYPAVQPFLETEDMGVFREHLKEVAGQAESENEEVLGWYHPHNLLGVALTARDSRLHMENFDQPWHCALVIVPERRRPKGGFFTRLREDVIFRRATVPFFEVTPRPEFSDQPAPSYVGWQNYEADRPYVRLLPDSPSDSPPGGIQGAGGSPPPDAELEADHSFVSELVSADPAPAASKTADVVDEPTETEAETSQPSADVEGTDEREGAPEAELPPESTEPDAEVPEPNADAPDAPLAVVTKDSGAGPDVEPAVEPAVEEGQERPLLEPVLAKRLEALRQTRPLVRAFGEPPDHSAAHAAILEVAGPDAAADEVAAREFLWQRWSRRSARSDSAE